MNLSVSHSLENVDYRHKKFNHLKRSRDDDEESSKEEKRSHYIQQEERCVETPFSISSDSSSSVEITGYVENSKDIISIPMAKRRRLQPSYGNGSLYNDSGISLTPRKQQQDDSISIVSNSDTLQRYTPTPLRRMPLAASTPTPLLTTLATPPTEAILTKISDDTLRSICKYHGNMVRKFPKKERTPKDQERRNKNTIACRMSRRVKKLEHIAIEEQYKEFTQHHFEIVEESMRAAAYLNELMKMSAVFGGGGVGSAISPASSADSRHHGHTLLPIEDRPSTSNNCARQVEMVKTKKPFSIAYLMGSDED